MNAQLNNGNVSNKQKGNYGEIVADYNMRNNSKLQDMGLYLKSIGRDCPTGLDSKIVKGIDGLYINMNVSSEYKYVIDEAKFGTARLGETKRDGTQMSHDWLTNSKNGTDRIFNAVGDKVLADDIRIAYKNGKVALIKSNIDSQGNIGIERLTSVGGTVKVTEKWI